MPSPDVAGDPVAALARIAYLLDRDLAPGRRAQAFHRAAAVADEAGLDELRRRNAAGTLTELPGIGAVTSGVITEALAGRTPEYLARLEAELPVAPARPGGVSLRDRLRGDCHTHSDWSDGGATIEAMARAAAALGHEYVVLTDHSARLTVAHGLSRDRLLRQLDVVGELNERLAPFRVLTGIEVDILEDGSLDADDDVLARLDLVVASAHSKLRMERRAMTERLVLAAANPHVDVIGHITGRNRRPDGDERRPDVDPTGPFERAGWRMVRPESTFDHDVVLMACKQFDTAVEVNCRPERLDPPGALLRAAVEYGCRLALDTDAHAPGQLEWQAYGCDRADAAGAAPESVVNTMGIDDLLAWTASHGG